MATLRLLLCLQSGRWLSLQSPWPQFFARLIRSSSIVFCLLQIAWRFTLILILLDSYKRVKFQVKSSGSFLLFRVLIGTYRKLGVASSGLSVGGRGLGFCVLCLIRLRNEDRLPATGCALTAALEEVLTNLHGIPWPKFPAK